MIRKDPIFKTLMLTRKGTIDKGPDIPSDPTRFAGEGLTFRAKLIGVLEVNAPRGDRLCQEALGELKMAVKAAGEHKQRIVICIALDGLRLRDERTGDSLYHHAVHKISFIAQDMSDPRAFGYIYGSPDQGHRFFGIKTDKHANLVVMAMRDLFQVVYDLKKQDGDKNKSNSALGSRMNGSDCFSDSIESLDRVFTMGNPNNVQTADLLDLQAEEKSVNSFDPFFGLEAKDSPRPSASALAPPLPPPPAGTAPFSMPVKLNSNFPEKFSDPVASRFSPLMPPPTKTAKPKADSISHYSTIRPRKKSAKDELSTLSQPFKGFNQPDNGKSLNNSFETQDSLNIIFKSNISAKGPSPLPEATSFNIHRDKFDCEPFIAKAKEPVDLFTELDPLNSGNTRPFVDKQFFFQELKKASHMSIELPQSTLREVDQRHRSLSGTQPVNYQPVADFQASLFDAHFSFEEPKTDPFDTNFVSSVCTAMSCQTEPTFSSLGYENSKAISSLEVRSDSFHPDFAMLSKPSSPRPPVVQNSFVTPETVKKKNLSPAVSFDIQKAEVASISLDESSTSPINWKSAKEPLAVPKLNIKETSSPVTLRRFSDTSSSEEAADFQPFTEERSWEQSNGHESVFASHSQPDEVVARVSSPPQPPPRPPILRPPPLPPKGQPPNIPQRSASVAVEETSTPPLPVPMRRAKHATSAKPTIQRVVSRAPVDELKRNSLSPKQPDINNISLIQLSNMSLSDLAATLKLPPVRVASMTLTELALRLNELNREPSKKSTHIDEEEEYAPKRNKRLSERSVEEIEDERDFEEEFEEDDDDDEEDEIEVSENKVQDNEVCYKGGKKYEMLSDLHDHEEELDIANKKLIEADTSTRSKCESATSTTSESDRYAALREIMEQDLANGSFQAESADVTFDGDVKFANFDGASFKELQPEPEEQLAEQSLGFEDDFSNLSVRFPPLEAASKVEEPNATSTPEATEVKIVFEDNFEADFNNVASTSKKEDFFASQPAEPETDELEKKFAAFEVRFPLNPVSGFADSFVNVESVDAVVNQPKSEASFDVDFDSAFQETAFREEAIQENVFSEIRDKSESLKSSSAVKKSTSVNIFNRIEDPFDDDFFQPSPSVPTNPKPSNKKVFATIVEDPFVWVQPFDDDEDFADSPEAFS